VARIPAVEIAPGMFMPLVDVHTVVLGVRLQFTALVDSGADRTMVPAAMLDALGIDVRSLPPGTPSLGANGTRISTKKFDTELSYRGRVFATTVSVLPQLPLPVVGRDDFMRKFTVHMHWNDNPPTWCATRIKDPR
jgi:hypothetical protein